ncbi:hypothetical protein DWF04_022770 [Cereibacter sphaeroides f. sp. denitrificans]|nr:hypothetical protein DWF04_15445 [Cereibacter sphaeroides f. sp. denitrificans]
MAWTQADIERAKANYAKGVLKLHLSNGEEVTFADGDDMLKRIRVMEAEASGLPLGRSRVSYARTGRGL